jgi:hypothetical protein
VIRPAQPTDDLARFGRAGITTVNVEYDTPYKELATLMTSMPVQATTRVSMWTGPR